MNKAQGAARLVANMLERDDTPVRREAAQELLEAVAHQERENQAWRERFPQYKYRSQDGCVVLA